jgi:hypothetical protein
MVWGCGCCCVEGESVPAVKNRLIRYSATKILLIKFVGRALGPCIYGLLDLKFRDRT